MKNNNQNNQVNQGPIMSLKNYLIDIKNNNVGRWFQLFKNFPLDSQENRT
jgi:hypothetical protein